LTTSPLYYFESSTSPVEGGYPVKLIRLNVDTNQTTQLFNITWPDLGHYTPRFYGTVLYYKTGVIYGTYWQEVSQNQVNGFLLAVNTSNGALLFDNFKFCEGVVSSGLAIDQTTGDIHFLNHTSALQTVDIPVDWTKWNIETNTTSIVLKRANNGTDANGNIVYNSITSTLWYLNSYQFIAYTATSHFTQYISGIYYNHLAINQKNGDLYASTGPYPFAVTYLQFNTTSVIGTNECTGSDTRQYVFSSYSDASDFDYVSDTFALTLNAVTKINSKNQQTTNDVFSVNVDTCSYLYYQVPISTKQDPKAFFSPPRFNCAESS